MVFKEINSDPSLYCNSCFSRVAKVTVRFGTVNNAIAVRLCRKCYGKLSSPQQEELEAQIEKMKCDVNTNIKVAQQNNDWLMESKLASMILQWEGKRK